jgi:hypothetical protein
MTSPAVVAPNAIDITKSRVSSQQIEIDRQRELVAKLERGGDAAMLAEADQALADMGLVFGRTPADHAAA